jgi:chorismate mutase
MELAKTQVGEHLNGLRKKIDALDEALVRLLNARAACALEIRRARGQLGGSASVAATVDTLAGLRRFNSGPLDDAAIRRLFDTVNDEASDLAGRQTAAVKPPNSLL